MPRPFPAHRLQTKVVNKQGHMYLNVTESQVYIWYDNPDQCDPIAAGLEREMGIVDVVVNNCYILFPNGIKWTCTDKLCSWLDDLFLFEEIEGDIQVVFDPQEQKDGTCNPIADLVQIFA